MIITVRAMILMACLQTMICQSGQTSEHQIYLDPSGRYHFQWSVDYQKQAINVKLTAQVTSQSWFAFGFSDYGDVTSADLISFWTDEQDIHHFVDGQTDSIGILEPDRSQDYNLTAVASDNGSVVLEFHRAFDTCDLDDYILDNGTTHVIFVESDNMTGPPFGCDVTLLRHGVQRVQILKPELSEAQFPKDTWVFEVRAPQIIVPPEETTYWWQTSILPDITTPHHIIQYEGIIAEGNEDLVHHMEVFHCEVKDGHSVPYYSGPGLSEGKPEGLDVCTKVIGAWAMGAQAMVYPEEAGAPIGGGGYSRVAVLEVHYNNPRKTTGRVDTSGIRFYVTSYLRKFEAAIMELGLEYTNKMTIPPGQESFTLTGYCIKECTQVGLSLGGIHVFASQLHTHLTGRRVYTKHIRQGRELPELNRDNHYSPHFQEIRRLPQPVHVLPGDDLVTSCEYDTSSRPRATVGGFSITDEMCINYIHYYPRTDLETCKSSIQTHALDTFMFFLKRFEDAEVYPWAGYRANYMNIEWSPTNINLLMTLYESSSLSMQCNKSDGSRFPGDWEHSKIPEITEKFEIPNSLKVC